MKNKFPFEFLDEDGLLIVLAEINEETTLRFLIDTGSTHTCIDKNVLYIEQINLKEALGKVEIETANGWILADIFNIPSIEVLGMKFNNHPMQVMDFIEHRIMSDYSGIIGFDILCQKNLCIHFKEGFLTFE
jgi:predicted aspartyl protease